MLQKNENKKLENCTSTNYISVEVKDLAIEHLDEKREKIIDLMKKNDTQNLITYMKNNKIEFENLNDEHFNIIEYIYSSKQISFNMKYYVINHYGKTRRKIIQLIKNNSVKHLMTYLEKNDIELERIFVLTHVNKKRYEMVERIECNNLDHLMKYIKENDIELKEYNDKYFDIIRHTNSLYNRRIISCMVKDFVIASFDRKRRKLVEYIKSNDLDGLIKYIIENNIGLKELNDSYINIVNYTCFSLNKISPEIKNFVKANHNRKGSQILIELIKENKYNRLKKFVDKNKFSLKSLNNNNFDILDYSTNLFKTSKISLEMKNFIFNNYDQKRSDVIHFINKNEFENLKEYSKINNIVFEELDDKYCNIKNLSNKLFNQKIISYKMKQFILAHYNKERSDIVYIIQANDIEKLKSYIQENDIEIRNLNDEYFDIIKYVLIYVENISPDIVKYLVSHISGDKEAIINLLKLNNIKELRDYMDKRNITLETVNVSSFDILKYTETLYDKNKIKQEIRDYIFYYFISNDINSFKELIKSNDILKFKNFVERNNIEFQKLNNDQFNIIDYCNSSENSVSTKMKNFIISHYTKKRWNVVELIKNNDILKLKYYVVKNNIEFQKLNDDQFNIIDYCNSMENKISQKMKYYVLSHYTRERWNVVELLRSNDISKLIEYIETKKIELASLCDKNFDLIQFCNCFINNVFPYTRDFVISHYTRERYAVVELLRKNNINLIKSYYNNNRDFEFKKLDDNFFNILDYCRNPRNGIKIYTNNYVLSHYTRMRGAIIDLIQDNKLDSLKKYIDDNNIELASINDKNFNFDIYHKLYLKNTNDDILLYLTFSIKKYFNVIELIKKNNVFDLENYITQNKIELKQLTQKNFNLINYCFKLKNKEIISNTMKNYVINHYDQERGTIVNLILDNSIEKLKNFIEKNNIDIKNINEKPFNILDFCLVHIIMRIIQWNKFNELKRYSLKNKIEFKKLNDENFNIVQYCNSSLNTSVDIKEYIITHWDNERYMFINFIKNNQINNIKYFLKTRNTISGFKDLNDEYFSIMEYCNNKDNKIFSNIKEYIISHYYKHRGDIDLNDENFNLLSYYRKFDKYSKYSIIKNYILTHYNEKRKEVFDIIEENNLNKLKKYVTQMKNFDFMQLNDQSFNILDYINEQSNSIPNDIKIYIKYHYNHKRSEIIELIELNNFTSLKYYIVQNNILITDVNDKYFNLLNFAISKDASSEIIKYIIDKFSIAPINRIQDSPLFHALSNTNYRISNLLLQNNNIRINDLGDQLLLKLWKSSNKFLNKRNINYLLKNDFNANCMNKALQNNHCELLLEFLHNNNNLLEVIFNHYIYSNTFIIMMLSLSKERKSMSKFHLKSILENERKKFNYNSWRYDFIKQGKIKLFNKYFNNLEKIIIIINNNDNSRPSTSNYHTNNNIYKTWNFHSINNDYRYNRKNINVNDGNNYENNIRRNNTILNPSFHISRFFLLLI
ncbi:hypothetical protein H8356DRAFT_1377288 [Neocallimastix lanati (nom. inval.)]|nr:hypothetical protein H8356DRAFT_1377288 [Neocallimastix sp. JGI-2020a]